MKDDITLEGIVTSDYDGVYINGMDIWDFLKDYATNGETVKITINKAEQ